MATKRFYCALTAFMLATLLALSGASFVVAANGTDAPATQPRQQKVANIVAQLVDQLNDPDAQVRKVAGLKILNIGGDGLQPVEAALSRGDLSPEALQTLRRALPRLKVRAAKLQRTRQETQWVNRTMLEQYEKVGQKDPAWDAVVRQGMHDFAIYDLPHRTAANTEFRKAIDLGCNDAMVLYLEARTFMDLPDPQGDEVTEHLKRSAGPMLASKYDAAHKAIALYRCFQHAPDDPVCSPDEILKQLAESGKIKDVPPILKAEPLEGLMTALTQSIGREGAFKKIDPAYRAAFPDGAEPFLFEGRFYINFAWDARGSGWANSVTPEGWKLFGERLDLAEAALQKGWNIDPSNGDIGAEMVTCQAGKGNPQAMLEWFSKATKADPDNFKACAQAMNFLQPKWYGSISQLLDFGHDCAKTQNYYASIPFILMDIHEIVAEQTPNPDQYMQSAEVWADVSKVFDEALVMYRTPYLRCRYAILAGKCGRWDVANTQYDLIGDKPDPRVFPDKTVYDRLREHAREMAQKHKQADKTGDSDS